MDVFLGVFVGPLNLLPQNRYFVRGLRQFSSHLRKSHACHGICTVSPLDAALPMRFAKNTQHDTSKVLRLPRKMMMDTSKVLRLPRKLQRIFWKRRKSILRLPHKTTRCKTRLNVKNCHACHAKRSNETFETSKNDHSCRTYHRATRPYGDRTDGCGRLRAVANGCGRLRTVANKTQRRANTPSAPRPPCETGTLATHSGKVPHSPERNSI